MTARATIQGSGHSYAILLGTRIIARATTYDSAAARANNIEARALIRPRKCLSCAATFNSAHAGNRICGKCKKG